MTTNKLKKIWDKNNYALNGWISINNPFSAEIMSRQNYDTLTIDMQHYLIYEFFQKNIKPSQRQ